MNDAQSPPRRFDLQTVWSAALSCVAIAIAGCSTPRPAADATAWSVTLPVKLLDAAGHPLPTGEPTLGTAWLGSVAGSVFGDPKPPFMNVKVSAEQTIHIDLQQLQQIGEAATSITANALERGWRIVPAETRFSRVSTTFNYLGSPATRTGFMDAVSGSTLLLVYFDRPCRLTGTVIGTRGPGDPTRYVFDVTAQKAGFYWLSIDENHTDHSAVVRRADASVQPIYRVWY